VASPNLEVRLTPVDTYLNIFKSFKKNLSLKYSDWNLPGVDSARWRSDLVDPHSPQCPTENTTKGAHSRPSKIRKSMNHIESSNIYIYILKDMKEIKYWIILKDILTYLKYIQGYRNISNHHERVRETHQRHVDRVGSVERPQPEVGHQKPSPRVAQPLPALSRDSDLEPHTVPSGENLLTRCMLHRNHSSCGRLA